MEAKLGTKENPRHILGLSGGKDSTALAIHIKNTRPEIFEKLELFFTDTGTELQELYEYLDVLEAYLEKPIFRIKAVLDEAKTIQYKVEDENDTDVPFDEVLYEKYNGFLPAPQARWCTRSLKIIPMQKWIGKDACVSYVGIRADEMEREGYVPPNNKLGKKVIYAVYPLREDGIMLNDVYKILEESVGIPPYYKWRTRSGCYFCFYQRRVEYAMLYFLYPQLFKDSQKYETTHDDGRQFTWMKGVPLDYIEENATKVVIRYIRKQYKKVSEEYAKEFVLTLDQMTDMINAGRIQEFIDTWDLKRLHDVDSENKDGCTVCAI